VPVELRPIADADVPRVAEFLQDHMEKRVPAEEWARSLDVPWRVNKPNNGFMLLDDGRLVGAHVAYYSERLIDGRPERFCNLGAFCVLPEHRFHSVRLLKALLSQEGYHFTDLSPYGSVIALNERLDFRFLDTSSALVPNLPWPSWPGREAITSRPELIEKTLRGRDLELYRDHAEAGAARHLLLTRGEDSCYVVIRKDRRKGLPLFASILYVSDPELFRKMARPFARHLLIHHGALATLAEDRVVEHRPFPSLRLRSPRKKMFRSSSLGPAKIDYFYSELVCLSW
jgi:hypothetical protein